MGKGSKTFEQQGRIHEAKAVLESLYHEITDAQIEENCYILKGMPIAWMRGYCIQLNQPWLAQRYRLLTIIEDAIASEGNIGPNSVGSYFRAVWYHNIEDAVFQDLVIKTWIHFPPPLEGDSLKTETAT